MLKNRNFAQLQFKITVYLIFSFFIVLLAFNCYTLFSNHAERIKQHADYAYSLSRAHLGDAINIYDGNVASHIIRNLENDPLIYSAVIQDIDGIRLSSFTKTPDTSSSFLYLVHHRIDFKQVFLFKIFKGIAETKQEIGSLSMGINAYELFYREIIELLISILQTMIWTALVITIVSVIIFYRIAKPITDLSHLVDEIDFDNSNVIDFRKIQKSSSYEVQVLCNTLEKILSNASSTIEAKNTKVNDLKVLSETDEMTNIMNRRAFFSNIQKDIHDQKQFTIVYIDIDHFKQINDNFGHDVGDYTICETVKTIKHELREIDKIGRIGGEEFAVQINTIDNHLVSSICERIRKRVAETNIIQGNFNTHITISLGACIGDHPHLNVTTLCKIADNALYEAKNSGRNKSIINSYTLKKRQA